jgi:hypothetical protein
MLFARYINESREKRGSRFYRVLMMVYSTQNYWGFWTLSIVRCSWEWKHDFASD